MKMNRLLQACIAVVIILTAGQLPVRADASGERPLWNAAWITDTQTADSEWITALTARVRADKPEIILHTGDTRFEWANRCAWKDSVDLMLVQTPPTEFHLAPGNHDLTNGVLKLHLRRAATTGIYLLDTGLIAEGRGYYHNRITEDAAGPLWPLWNPEVVNHPAWQIGANEKPAHWQHPELPYHYVFRRGRIRFIVCDCFFTQEQKAWLQDILQKPDDSSVSIVLQHKHEVDDLAQYFDGLEGKHNVKLVLSGDHHNYCYEQRKGITYITAAGIARGRDADCDAMTLWVYPDRLELDRYTIAKGFPINPIRGPETIWTCPGAFTDYQRPEFAATPAKSVQGSGVSTTTGSNLIKNGDFDNSIWYERYRGWTPSYWYQWFQRGGHVPEHAVGKRLPHSSREYVRLHMWAHAWTGGILQNVPRVEPCRMYKLTAYGFFQPKDAPKPNARIGIDPSGRLAGQFSADAGKHPAPKYDEGVGDDPATEKDDGPYFSKDTVWSGPHDYYSWGKCEVIAEARADTITAILYCSPQQRPAEKPIYEMNWDSVTLREVPWPTRRLIDDRASLTPDPGFSRVKANIFPEARSAQITWRTKAPAGASQVLYRFLKEGDLVSSKQAQPAGTHFDFETLVVYEDSERFHRVEIENTRLETADVLEFVALSRTLIDGQCITLCSSPVRIKLAPRLPIPSAKLSTNWRNNIIADGTMSRSQPTPGIVRFDMQFAETDPWCYPILELKDDEIPDSSFAGLALTVNLLEGAGTIRVQFVEDNGAQ